MRSCRWLRIVLSLRSRRSAISERVKPSRTSSSVCAVVDIFGFFCLNTGDERLSSDNSTAVLYSPQTVCTKVSCSFSRSSASSGVNFSSNIPDCSWKYLSPLRTRSLHPSPSVFNHKRLSHSRCFNLESATYACPCSKDLLRSICAASKVIP